jgi:two-component system, OmpR family, sensor kinase
VITLRRRLFVAVLAAIVVSVALTIAFGAVLARRTADRTYRNDLAARAQVLAVGLPINYKSEVHKAGSVTEIVDRLANMHRYVANVDRPSSGNLTVRGVRYLYSYRPAPPRGVLLLEPAKRPTEWGSFLRDLALAGGVGAIIAALISFLLARSVAAPIGRVAEASRALAAGESPAPVPVERTAELAELAQAFNDMSAQLDASRESERSFLLSVSHELKTPLTAIRGYAEGLAEGAFAADAAADTILVEARRLERLVGDLLDLARMNRHTFEVRCVSVDLATVAAEVVARHEGAAREFGVALAAEGDTAWVSADHDRLLQIASNLVENALRETPRDGSVVVRAAPGRLVVADTGPGLDADDLEHAFDRFFLYDRYGRERPVGSGLGLAIVKQLTLAMGGTVSVESAPGRGASFTVALRPASGAASEPPVRASGSVEGVRGRRG